MPICIVAATALELQHLPASPQHKIFITGVGAAATIYGLLQEFQSDKPSLIIQAGIAGSFDVNISLGEAVIVAQDRFADLGVTENNKWNDVFDMNLAEANEPPYTDGWLVNPYQDLLNSTQLPRVKSISINEVTTSSARIEQIRTKYLPAIESMEGAAFHYTCLRQRIPFLQLRTISNYVGERNKSKWQLSLAVENLAARLQSIISQVSA